MSGDWFVDRLWEQNGRLLKETDDLKLEVKRLTAELAAARAYVRELEAALRASRCEDCSSPALPGARLCDEHLGEAGARCVVRGCGGVGVDLVCAGHEAEWAASGESEVEAWLRGREVVRG